MITFLFSPAGRWLAGAVAAVALLWGAYTYVDNGGYHRAAVEYQAKYDKLVSDYKTARADEIERQESVNAASKAREARQLAELQAANDELEIRIKELASEASQDPNAGEPALRAPSVQRINKIR